jgi:hypothetical protein
MVSYVGSALLRLLGDTVGLTTALSKAPRVRGLTPDIDRGGVRPDLAVAVTDGATGIDDDRALRDQGDLFGHVASTPTAWRCLNEIGYLQLVSPTSGTSDWSSSTRESSRRACSTRPQT